MVHPSLIRLILPIASIALVRATTKELSSIFVMDTLLTSKSSPLLIRRWVSCQILPLEGSRLIPTLSGGGRGANQSLPLLGFVLRRFSPGFFLLKTFQQLLAFCGNPSLTSVTGEVPRVMGGRHGVQKSSRFGVGSSKRFKCFWVLF